MVERVFVTDAGAIQKTLEYLLRGTLVIVPTDTVYGIGCDAGSNEAVGALFRVKARAAEKQIPFLVSDLAMAETVVQVPDMFHDGLRELWPGALTGVFVSRKGAPTQTIVQSGGGVVGVRIPDYPFLQSVLQKLGRPMAVSSANISGRGPYTKIADVLRDFEGINGIGLVVDAGDLPDRMASTVVDFTKRPPQVLREGEITRDALESAFRMQFR